MTVTTSPNAVYFDPFDQEIKANPYPVYKRLRDEAPLYYNEAHDFYVVSRFADVLRFFVDKNTFISSKGMTIDMIKQGVVSPPGLFVNEDPPQHTRHRAAVSILFTPGHIAGLEDSVRQLCVRTFSTIAESGGIDLVRDVALEFPMHVVGMLIGIPEEERAKIRDHFENHLQAAHDEHVAALGMLEEGYAMFSEYIDWRANNPSDDLMTQLMTLEFEDDEGVMRKLTRDEILIYLILIAGAGNDTTTQLIGWMGKILADNPEQRRALVDDFSLIPNAVEEILRLEPPAYHVARYVAHDTEFHGRTVPEGSAILGLPAAGNRDDRQFENADMLDVRRPVRKILSFGYGAHHCLGSALARLEGRIVLEELLSHFPTWEVDEDNAELTPGYITRGWARLPITF
jgi:cytochrome P450